MSQTSRRGFLGTAARWGAAVGLGALVARLAGRAPAESDGKGPVPPCARCAALSTCNRPDGVRAQRQLGVAPVPRNPRATHASPLQALCGRRPDGELVSRWVRREES